MRVCRNSKPTKTRSPPCANTQPPPFPMVKQLTVEDARESLNAHLAAKGDEIHARYGPFLNWNELLLILNDRSCVRYPCEIRFDSQLLLPGEFAHPMPKGTQPE